MDPGVSFRPMEQQHLMHTITEKLRASLTEKSWSTYQKTWKQYQEFSAAVLGQYAVLPYPVINILYYIAFLVNKRLSPATITTQVSEISFLHKMNTCWDPTASFLVRKMLVGIKKDGSVADVRLPITPHLLTRIFTAAATVLASPFRMECI